MKRTELQTMYGETPDSFKMAVQRSLSTIQAKPVGVRRPLRTLALAAACLLVFMGAAYAAFHSQVAMWFGKTSGEKTEVWLTGGNADAGIRMLQLGDAVFTLEEVVQRNRGIYGVGTVTLKEGSRNVLIAEDQDINEPFGYDVHGAGGSPQAAPEGTPALIEKARAQGGKLLLAIFRLDAVGVDGGEVLPIGSVGYRVFPERDGRLRVLFEAEEGVAIEEGENYKLSLRAATMELDENGAVKEDTRIEKTWDVDIAPQPIVQ